MKYIKVNWPEYQEYMEHPYFREMSYYHANDNSYFIPEDLINQVESGLICPYVYENTSLGNVTLYETYATVNEKETFYYKEPKRGDKLLIFLYDKKDFMIATCKAASKGMPILIDELNLLEGIHFEIIGCHE